MRLLPFPGVFKPHSDSLLLADHITREPLPAGSSVLDLCAGSGLLAIVAARRGARRVVAVDASSRALLATRLNAALNGVSVKAVRGDLFAAVRGERFDLIVSNPPYVPSESDSLPSRGLARAWEAGPRGRAFIDRICSEVREHLNPGGVLLLVHSSLCAERATVDALASHGLRARVAERRRGPLGRLISARAELLRARGLLRDQDQEDVVIVRAQRAA